MKKLVLGVTGVIAALLVLATGFVLTKHYKPRENKRFAIVIASFNNAEYVDWNIMSALNQNYDNFHIVYVNDQSTDGTIDVLKDVLKREKKEHMVTIVDNKIRKGALRNIYEAIHNHTQDNEIVVSLDGDDALANENVLSYLNKTYTDPWKEVWMTYGQFREKNSGNKGFCSRIPKHYIRNNSFREFGNIPSHLRTFYSWLFKSIKKEDLLYNGEFFTMSWDMAFMYPMIEMSHDRFKYIRHVLYIYNDNNPLSDHRVDMSMQRNLDRYIRTQDPYKMLEQAPVKTNI